MAGSGGSCHWFAKPGRPLSALKRPPGFQIRLCSDWSRSPPPGALAVSPIKPTLDSAANAGPGRQLSEVQLTSGRFRVVAMLRRLLPCSANGWYRPFTVFNDTSKPTVARPYSRLTWVPIRGRFTTAPRPQFYATASVDAPSTRGKVSANVLPCPKPYQSALLIWPSSSCKSSSEFIWSSSSSHSSSTHSASVAMVMATAFLIRR